MPIGIQDHTISSWQHQLAQGHTITWLATAITLWGLGVIALTWWIVQTKPSGATWILAGILLYEVLP